MAAPSIRSTLSTATTSTRPRNLISLPTLHALRSFSTSTSLRDDEEGGERGARQERILTEAASREHGRMMAWYRLEGDKYRFTQGKPMYVERAKRPGQKDKEEKEEEGQEDNKKARRRANKREGLPFPLNPFFRSEPVLSENLKEAIYVRVAEKGQPVREVSDLFKVSMERIAAVVRMKQMERDWVAERKKLTPFLNEYVMDMLPQTAFKSEGGRIAHESNNDLPVHPSTTQQIFWPTSEAKHFTRVDAGTVFAEGLLPADLRIPLPEVVDKWAALEMVKRPQAILDLRKKLEDAAARRARAQVKFLEENVTVVEKERYNVRIENVEADITGRDGKSPLGVGRRYGVPHPDRKKGLIKIPTKV